MATNNILNIPQWILTGSVSQPDAGFSKIYPKKGETSSWYIVDEVNSEKRLALDYFIGSGLSQSLLATDSKYGYRLDVLIGAGLTYASGPIQNAVISVAGLTPSMLAITGSFTYGYVLSTSTYSGEFVWVPNTSANIKGDLNRVAKFAGPDSLTSSLITDDGQYVYIGSTPSNTFASFSVDGFVNIGSSGTGSRLYFGDAQNHYLEKEFNGGLIIRTEDEFRVDHYTNSSTTYKVIDFDHLGNENRTLGFMNNLIQVGAYTYSSFISASNVNYVRFGRTQSSFQLELISGSQGAVKIQDGSQASYSVFYSDSQGVGKWGQIFGYNGLTTSELGIGLNLVNIQGLTLSGGTFGLDYTKFAAPISVSNTFTVSLATVSVTTGVTYGSMFETPTFRVDQFGRVIGIGTVSTMAFTGPQGPTGTSFVWQGTYATSSTYSLYNVVEYSGSSYISLGTASPGLTPSTVTQSWNLLASKGTDGATGTSFVWMGSYATTSTYNLYEVVQYSGSSYISITTSNLGYTPSIATQSWDLMAASGSGSGNGMDLIAGTFGDIMVYGQYGWTALGLGPSGSYLYSLGTESNSLPIWVTQSQGLILTQDFTVNLKDRYFGRYNPGDVIPSGTEGWTIEKFIFMVLNDNLKPTVTLVLLTPAQGTLAYGTTPINFLLGWNYTINNVLEDGTPAAFESAILEWTTDSLKINWNLLFDTTIPKDSISPPPEDNPFPFNYTVPDTTFQGIYYFRYTVYDTKGDSNFAEVSIDVTDYVLPDVVVNVSGTEISQERGETDVLRELGNVSSNVGGIATRNTPSVDLTNWSLQWRKNSEVSFAVLSNGSFGSGAGGSVTLPVHDSANPSGKVADVIATSLSYRLRVDDSRPSNRDSATKTVNFEPLIYYGPVTDNSWIGGVSGITRADLFDFATTANGGTEGVNANGFYRLKLESKGIANEKITFITGGVAKIFIVAIPNKYEIIKAESVQNGVPGNILSKYAYYETLNLKNFDGSTESPYKVFCHTQSGPYIPAPGSPVSIEITLALE
jgi:hypothetical protein